MSATTPDAEELAKRREAVEQAAAHSRLAGLKLDEEAQALFDRYVSGELSDEELEREMEKLNERDFGPIPSRGSNDE